MRAISAGNTHKAHLCGMAHGWLTFAGFMGGGGTCVHQSDEKEGERLSGKLPAIVLNVMSLIGRKSRRCPGELNAGIDEARDL